MERETGLEEREKERGKEVRELSCSGAQCFLPNFFIMKKIECGSRVNGRAKDVGLVEFITHEKSGVRNISSQRYL